MESCHQPERAIELRTLGLIDLDSVEQTALDMNIDDLNAYFIDARANGHQLRQDIVAFPSLLEHALDAPDLTLDPPQATKRLGRMTVGWQRAGVLGASPMFGEMSKIPIV
jgi:hypothetical protein